MKNNKNSSELIYENYSEYLKENEDQFNSPERVINTLRHNAAWEGLKGALLQNIDESKYDNISTILDRQRELLMEEVSQSTGPSTTVYATAGQLFPLIADIYSEAVLNEVSTIHTISQPFLQINRAYVEGITKHFDGTTTKHRLPTNQKLVRSNDESILLSPLVSNNLFTSSTASIANPENSKVNTRLFHIHKINYSTDISGTVTAGYKEILLRPDARGQIKYEFDFEDPNNDTVNVKITGNMNWEKGIVIYSAIFANTTTPTSTAEYTLVSMESKCRFQAFKSDYGRVKVISKFEGLDIQIDVNEDFLIELDAELIQNIQDTTKIDPFKTISLAIKQQMLHNKELEIAYFLEMNIPTMVEYGAAAVVDIEKFYSSGTILASSNIQEVFMSILPKINKISKVIQRNFNVEPNYILTGMDTAAILSSIQSQTVRWSDTRHADAGFFSSGMPEFMKMKVIYSNAIPNDTIYLVSKPTDGDLTKAVILDVVYKPMYTVEEITNFVKLTSLRSRTAIEIVRPEGLGVIKVKNYGDFFDVASEVFDS